MPTKRQKATDGGCRAKTKAGSPCADPAMKGGGFLFTARNPERPFIVSSRTSPRQPTKIERNSRK
jgi:hypothetical protein